MKRKEIIPAIRIIIEAIDGTITTREADVVKPSYRQPTVSPNVHKVLFFPSLHKFAGKKSQLTTASINLRGLDKARMLP